MPPMLTSLSRPTFVLAEVLLLPFGLWGLCMAKVWWTPLLIQSDHHARFWGHSPPRRGDHGCLAQVFMGLLISISNHGLPQSQTPEEPSSPLWGKALPAAVWVPDQPPAFVSTMDLAHAMWPPCHYQSLPWLWLRISLYSCAVCALHTPRWSCLHWGMQRTKQGLDSYRQQHCSVAVIMLWARYIGLALFMNTPGFSSCKRETSNLSEPCFPPLWSEGLDWLISKLCCLNMPTCTIYLVLDSVTMGSGQCSWCYQMCASAQLLIQDPSTVLL